MQLYLQLKVVQLYLGVFARVSRDLTTCNGDAEIEARSYCNILMVSLMSPGEEGGAVIPAIKGGAVIPRCVCKGE